MTSTTHAGFRTTPPLTGTVCRLITPPGFRPTLLSRIGAWLFAASDAEATWWHWEIRERHFGLGRRYHDPRFYLRTVIPGPARAAEDE